MKKILKYFLLASLSLVLFLGNATNIYGASASLTGPSTVRAGDTITLKLMISDDGKYGLEGELSYDSSQVTLTSSECSLKGWKVENNGNTIIVYDDAYATALKGSKNVLTLKFKVKSGLAEGTKINISVNNIVTTDGTNENNLGKASYSVSIAKPLSTNANLASLSVSEGTLSPAFSASTTSYDIGMVDYSVSKLTINCSVEDKSAKVAIKGNNLGVGKNTVSVIVTAENGSTKTYSITVTRKQDPNYQASNNANLSSISVSHGMISPTFAADVTDYVVYLPYECSGAQFVVTGRAADAKAQGIIDGTIDKLAEGKNQTVVVCKAEDGTEKSYAITVVVMPKYEGEVPNIGGASGGTDEPSDEPGENPEDKPTEDPSETPSETPSTEEQEDTEASNKQDKDDKEDKGDNGKGMSGIITVLVVLVVIGLVGALVYVLFFSNKKF